MKSRDESLVARGYRMAEQVTRHHAKSFFFASFMLFGMRRKAAFALYAFCRRLDDMVDVADGADKGAVPADLAERLTRARRAVAELFLDTPELADPRLPPPATRASGGEGPWHPAELAALVDCIQRFRVPEYPMQELISGMEMDLTIRRYDTWSQLDLYCYRVAGVVGLMMAAMLGCSEEWALGPAADLGRGMQLTNILRDVGEDLERDRVYLPLEELAAFGLSLEDLRRGVVDERWRDFMRWQIARARAYYERAAAGIPALSGFGSQRMVMLMGSIYGDILRVIEERDFDVFSGRSAVTKSRKFALATHALVRPATVPLMHVRAPGEAALPLLPSTRAVTTGSMP
ncbi:Phytoene synthase [Cystobacter fuscus DSM 2262]|uniref:Phytoene synthase n=1 Tax=Cystobacter fuscus (strain ATCC 25194 / DSM 2262 / NBRC 100088 / M29) TaxID=1242864 RepID=S9QG14_CYSF2|nr:phytoene/squalene synthase family protein [Cystobacter fuscus]EPX55313.1 Phytoene synthase [Cystobacter fuscus DSM 2262]